MTDTDDMWRAIGELRRRIAELEAARQASATALSEAVGGVWAELAPALERIQVLETSVTAVHAEIIDDLRNRVYALEHGTRYVPMNEADDLWDDEDES